MDISNQELKLHFLPHTSRQSSSKSEELRLGGLGAMVELNNEKEVQTIYVVLLRHTADGFGQLGVRLARVLDSASDGKPNVCHSRMLPNPKQSRFAKDKKEIVRFSESRP